MTNTNDISDFVRYYLLPKIVADSTSMPIIARDYEICGCSLRLNKLIVDNIAISAIFSICCKR